ncbi:Fc.00g084160.m01.CDS01 [Cosmosporella sp. VM-42]
MGNSSSTPGKEGKSIYQRYQDKKNGPGISDEDLKKYTGKTREELNAWADTQPGVGKNQLAGKISMGGTSGLGGVAAADGYGGWGPSAEPNDGKRGMKFPPVKDAKA